MLQAVTLAYRRTALSAKRPISIGCGGLCSVDWGKNLLKMLRNDYSFATLSLSYENYQQ